MKSHVWFLVCGWVIGSAGCVAMQEDPDAAPSGFSLIDSVDDIDVTEGITTDARVLGRLQRDIQYRGFTLVGRPGDQLNLTLAAQGESNGYLAQAVQSRFFVYGPVADPQRERFTTLVADSGMGMAPNATCTLPGAGHYLIAVTSDRPQEAQFELNVRCPRCNPPPDPTRLCNPRSGTLFIEGAVQQSQIWDACTVVMLEPMTFPAGQTLTIRADVDVRAHYYITDFHDLGWGEGRLVIDGNLVMESDAQHPILFHSNVPGKQWAGIDIKSNGTSLHHFALRDSYDGLRILANGVSVQDAEISLNRVGLMLAQEGVNGTTISRVHFLDNRTALTNRYYDSFNTERGSVANLRIADSEFEFNDKAIDLRFVTDTTLSNIAVHHNQDGLTVTNNWFFDAAPETKILIDASNFHHNLFGIDLRGSGVVDQTRVENNDTFGIRTGAGWQKIRNTLVQNNGYGCQLSGADTTWQTIVNCGGGIIAEVDAHTVIRNDAVRNNGVYGIIMRGAAFPLYSPPRAVNPDPAILNSEISGNRYGGILLYDAPTTSIEFNRIGPNGPTELLLAYSTAGNGCQPLTASDTSRCRVRDHRIDRNNVTIGQDLFRFIAYGTARTRVSVHDPAGSNTNSWPVRTLQLGRNYYNGLTRDQVFPQVEADRVNLDVLLQPEPQAGLVVPLQ